MFYSIAVVLITLWLLGLITTYTIGGLVNVLLIIAAIIALLTMIGRRSTV